jgi:ribosome-binding factor A
MTTRRSTRRGTARDYPRTARLNELVREIIGDELERIDDDRLVHLTVISVAVEPDLHRAVVFYDHLDGAEADEVALTALGEHRIRLQAAIGRQARMKRTPELSFQPDPSVRSGERIDSILRDLPPADDADEPADEADEPGAAGPSGPEA